MFPVPAHLPRSTGDHLSSGTQAALAPGPADPVLELLNPLLGQAGPSKPARWSVAQVRKIREDLESAVNANKVRSRSSAVRTLFKVQVKTHQLVTSNFPAISTHIRLGKEIQEQSASVVEAIQKLEKSLDPSGPEVGRTGTLFDWKLMNRALSFRLSSRLCPDTLQLSKGMGRRRRTYKV